MNERIQAVIAMIEIAANQQKKEDVLYLLKIAEDDLHRIVRMLEREDNE